MDDLISRQAAIDAMANTLWHYPNECYRNLNVYEFAKGLAELGLKSVPSAQPERKKGKWNLFVQCPACGYKLEWNGEIFDFCPSCGAYMMGEAKN